MSSSGTGSYGINTASGSFIRKSVNGTTTQITTGVPTSDAFVMAIDFDAGKLWCGTSSSGTITWLPNNKTE